MWSVPTRPNSNSNVVKATHVPVVMRLVFRAVDDSARRGEGGDLRLGWGDQGLGSRVQGPGFKVWSSGGGDLGLVLKFGETGCREGAGREVTCDWGGGHVVSTKHVPVVM